MAYDRSQDVPRRRRWPKAEKRRLVAEVEAGRRPVAQVAAEHDVHPSLLARWVGQGAATWSRSWPGTARASACSASGWSMAASSGRRRPMAWSPWAQPSWACWSRASTGAPGAPRWLV